MQYDINKIITLIEYDMKMDHKLNKTMKASYMVMLKDFKMVNKETDKLLKEAKVSKTVVTLTDEPEPTSILAKMMKNKN